MRQYHGLVKEVLLNGVFRQSGRYGVDTIAHDAVQYKHDLSEGFPLLTTKRIDPYVLFTELEWFLQGSTHIKFLIDRGVYFWTPFAYKGYIQRNQEPSLSLDEFVARMKEDSLFAEEWGDLGEGYGSLWRHFKAVDAQGEVREIDQIANVIDLIKKNPRSGRIIMDLWMPAQTEEMISPPCAMTYAFQVIDEKLYASLFQRSGDIALGVPFNFATLAALTQIIARETGYEPRRITHSLAFTNIYCGESERRGCQRSTFYQKELPRLQEMLREEKGYGEIIDWINCSAPPERVEGYDHVPLLLTQLGREIRPLPQLTIANKSWRELKSGDFILEGYDPHPRLALKVAV